MTGRDNLCLIQLEVLSHLGDGDPAEEFVYDLHFQAFALTKLQVQAFGVPQLTIIDLPTLLTSTSLAPMMLVLDFEMKRIGPFRLLTRPRGASAQESFCADYLTCMLPLTFWRAWTHRNGLVLLSHSMFTLSSVALPLIGALHFQRFDHSYERQVLPDMPIDVDWVIIAPRTSAAVFAALVLATISQWATAEELHALFGTYRFALEYQSPSRRGFSLRSEGALKPDCPQERVQPRCRKQILFFGWDERQPIALQRLSMKNLSLPTQRFLNILMGMLLKGYFDMLDRVASAGFWVSDASNDPNQDNPKSADQALLLANSGVVNPDFWIAFMVMLVVLIFAIIVDISSCIYCVIPRQPASLACRISYIHSSQTLLADGSSGSRLKSENGEQLLYGLGWYHTASGEYQVRFDTAEQCAKVYYCVDGPPNNTGV
ncbi:hypothetical protein P154DRAFT_535894 [Amniculicola lignicola CBS 123094]|uniref:Uncharacterized protein n=1 Tax=Amniculicola lignicola CBS 123094 TaxID=1392246 RepID=A0A6A5WIR3_9PLEO|nr:hypothetical protein P154DRAFT_535894 [Amniculicola lignicola CBS 123094]